MAGIKKWYQIETFDNEGPVGTYAAILTDLQAAEIKAMLDDAVARKIFPHYRLAPYPQKQAHVHALTFASAKSSVKDDMELAQRGGSSPEMGAAKRTTVERVERELHRFLSRHYRPRDGEEAYGFDIKIHRRIDVPDVVRHARGWTEGQLSDFVDSVMHERLQDFVQALFERYKWISHWFQEGRSGGWLVLVSHQTVLDQNGHIPEERVAREQRAFDRAAEGRLADLKEIEGLVERGIKDLVKDLEDPKWWGISPKDWSPRAR